MDIEMCVNSLSMPLPEDILKRKWAGDLDGAIRAIDARLQRELPDMLRARLVCEKERIRRLPTQYPWDRAKALEKLSELVGKTVTDKQLEELEIAGWVDFIYLNGEKRYFVRFHRGMLKGGALDHLIEEKNSPERKYLDDMIAAVKEKGEVRRRITLETSLSVDKEDFVPGEYLAHLPFPVEPACSPAIRMESGRAKRLRAASGGSARWTAGMSSASATAMSAISAMPIRCTAPRLRRRCIPAIRPARTTLPSTEPICALRRICAA